MRLPALSIAAVLFATAVHAAELSGTLRKVADSGSITLGVRERSTPFSYMDGGRPVGYSFEICMRVVDAVRRELNRPDIAVAFRLVTAADRLALIAAGQIDLECSTTTNNIERQRLVAFSNTIFLSASRFASRRADHLGSIESLRGHRVASTIGTTNLSQLTQLNLALGLAITVLAAPDTTTAFQMLADGRADAFVMDDVQLSSLIASSPDPAAYVISTDALSAAEPYGLVVRRDDPAFKAVVDRATADLFEGKDGQALYAKWFEAPIPPAGVNLKLPMGASLRHAFAHPSSSADPASYVE